MCRYAQFSLSSRQLNYRGFPLIFLKHFPNDLGGQIISGPGIAAAFGHNDSIAGILKISKLIMFSLGNHRETQFLKIVFQGCGQVGVTF